MIEASAKKTVTSPQPRPDAVLGWVLEQGNIEFARHLSSVPQAMVDFLAALCHWSASRCFDCANVQIHLSDILGLAISDGKHELAVRLCGVGVPPTFDGSVFMRLVDDGECQVNGEAIKLAQSCG